MNYDLAKELKDAGFADERFWLGDRNPEEPLPHPTLSELIEACGERFRAVIRDSATCWRADDVDDTCLMVEDTPEEAVAKLWLALNKK